MDTVTNEFGSYEVNEWGCPTAWPVTVPADEVDTGDVIEVPDGSEGHVYAWRYRERPGYVALTVRTGRDAEGRVQWDRDDGWQTVLCRPCDPVRVVGWRMVPIGRYDWLRGSTRECG